MPHRHSETSTAATWSDRRTATSAGTPRSGRRTETSAGTPRSGRRTEAPATATWSAKLRTPFAVLGVRSNGQALTEVAYLPLRERAQAPSDAIAECAVRELERWLRDVDYRFTVPLAPAGTPFQQRVWHAIGEIPCGQSRTYGELARSLASAPRSVGQACGSNPIALIIPCHRVIGSRGALGGFMHAASGDPLAIKRWLLVHEGYRFGLY
jgi:methylated-DNA-[protein]-cysteine S-methyltransferase